MSRTRSSSSSSYRRIGLSLASGPKTWVSKLHASPSPNETSQLDEVTLKVLNTDTKLFENFKANLRTDLTRSDEMKKASEEDAREIVYLSGEAQKKSQWLDDIK